MTSMLRLVNRRAASRQRRSCSTARHHSACSTVSAKAIGAPRGVKANRRAPASSAGRLEPAVSRAHAMACSDASTATRATGTRPRVPGRAGATSNELEHGLPRVFSNQGAERFECENVRRPFPNGEHLGVTKQRRKPRVFDVARTAKTLQDFACGRDGHLRREELRQWLKHGKDRALARGGLACFALAEREHLVVRETERRFVVRSEVGERLQMEGFLGKGRAERHAAPSVVARERQTVLHARDGAHGIPRARDVQH